MRPIDSFGQADEAHRQLALDLVGHADHGAFGDVGMGCQDLLHASCRKPVAGYIYHIVGPRHDPNVSVFVLHPGIAGFVIAGKSG